MNKKIIKIAWDAYKRHPENERNIYTLEICLDYAREHYNNEIVPRMKRLAYLLKELVEKEIETGIKHYFVNMYGIDLDEETGWHTYEYQECSLIDCLANPDTTYPDFVASEKELEENEIKVYEDCLIAAARGGYRLDEYNEYFENKNK